MNSPAASGGHGAAVRRWQLPADVSGFVGRSGELARLTGLLAKSSRKARVKKSLELGVGRVSAVPG